MHYDSRGNGPAISAKAPVVQNHLRASASSQGRGLPRPRSQLEPPGAFKAAFTTNGPAVPPPWQTTYTYFCATTPDVRSPVRTTQPW